MKILGVIAQEENGEIIFIKSRERSVVKPPRAVHVPLGKIVESPTPDAVKMEEDLEKPEVTLAGILNKYDKMPKVQQ